MDLTRLRRNQDRWPAPDGESPSRWYDDPPASDGSKIVITDTDHYAPGKGDGAVGLEVVPARPPPDPDGLRDYRWRRTRPIRRRAGIRWYASFEPARYAMGDTLG